MPSSAPLPNNDPAWLRWLTKYRGYLSAAVAAMAILLVGIRIFVKVKRKKYIATVSQPDELETPMELPQLHSASTALATAEQIATRPELISVEEDGQELARRIRELAKREPAITANALRMWLLQNETAKSGAQHA